MNKSPFKSRNSFFISRILRIIQTPCAQAKLAETTQPPSLTLVKSPLWRSPGSGSVNRKDKYEELRQITKNGIGTALLMMFLAGTNSALAQSYVPSSRESASNSVTSNHSDWQGTQTPFQYDQTSSPGHAELAAQGWADFTNTQGAGAPNGPLLYGTPSTAAGPGGQSGAATSAPFQGTYAAPGNFALRQMGQTSLPPTHLTSLVRDSGMSDAIYGDEGTSGPPPYEHFVPVHYIINGIESGDPGLTTGHPSGAHSAWGYPE